MKKALALILSLALTAALLAGCNSGNETPPPESGSAASDASGDASGTPAQELIIGEQFDLGSFDPAEGMLDDTQMLVYNQLVELDADFNQVPGLAESWEMSEDGTVWTFHLRQGVTFHDGESWNAEAALANLETRLEGYPATANVERYETPDEYTLVFHLTQPTYTLASDLARTAMGMASPAVIAGDGSLTAEAGTGPYTLADWSPDQSYTFEAWEDYWGGAPNIKKITFKVITDPQSRANALESGEIDMMSGYQSLAAIKRLKDDERFQLITKTQNTSGAIYFNLDSDSPVSELNVRLAVAQSLDLETIIDSVLAGLASPPTGFFSPAYGDLSSSLGQLYDPSVPEIAKKNLEDSGWALNADGIYEKDGAPLSFTLTYSAGNSEDSLLAPVFQDELKKVGIDMQLNAVEGAALDDLMTAKDFDAVLTGQSFIPTDEPSFHYAAGYWHSDSYYDIYHSDELDAMIDELATLMDPAERQVRHIAIQSEIQTQIPVLMVYHRNSVRLAKANIAGFDIGAGCWHVNVALKDAVVK